MPARKNRPGKSQSVSVPFVEISPLEKATAKEVAKLGRELTASETRAVEVGVEYKRLRKIANRENRGGDSEAFKANLEQIVRDAGNSILASLELAAPGRTVRNVSLRIVNGEVNVKAVRVVRARVA